MTTMKIRGPTLVCLHILDKISQKILDKSHKKDWTNVTKILDKCHKKYWTNATKIGTYMIDLHPQTGNN